MYQPPVRIIGKAGIIRFFGQRFDGMIVEAEVEDRIHHAGDGEFRAGPYADEKRIVAGAEALTLQLLEASKSGVHLLSHRGG